jgi:hypothetical protein
MMTGDAGITGVNEMVRFREAAARSSGPDMT